MSESGSERSWINDIHHGDAAETLVEMPESSVHCVMTSPPYWGLRDYSVDGQIGLEDSLNEYIGNLLDVADELRRVLRPDGSWWLNLGDSFAGSRGAQSKDETSNNLPQDGFPDKNPGRNASLRRKSKMLVPHRVAIVLQDAGWIVRADCPWVKPNPMPHPVKDRLHEHKEFVFHLTPEPDYWFDLDAVRQPHKEHSIERSKREDNRHEHSQRQTAASEETLNPDQFVHQNGKNPGDILEVAVKPFPDTHFACVSDDTEILTKEGWKTHDELRRGEKVATYDTDADRVELEPISSVHTYDVDTELLHIGNRDLDILITEDHRNVTRHRETGEIRIRQGYELVGRDKILVHAPVEWETNNGIGKPLAELLGWTIAEGHYRESGGIRIYQNEGADADRIDSLLDRLGVPHTRRGRRENEVIWSVPTGAWARAIRELAPEKRLTQYLVSLPKSDAKALFHGLVGGDGYERADGRIGHTEKDQRQRDWFQLLAFRLGYHAIDGSKDIHLTDRRSIGIRGTGGGGLNVDAIPYEGMVWCPKTPNGTWVARRNGRPFITGNTFPPELCEVPIKSSCPPTVCAECGAPYERDVEEVPVWERDRSTIEREQLQVALDRFDESDLTKENLKATRAKGFSDAAHGKQQSGAGRNTDRVEELAQEAKDVLGGYFREMTMTARKAGDWSQACDCDTDRTEAGIVLDPFAGAGTTCLVAKDLGRRFIGIDLNPEYVAMAQKRVGVTVDQPELLLEDSNQATLPDGGGQA